MTARPEERADGWDTALIALFLFGIYLGYSPKLAAGIPMPSVLAAVAGGLMLLRHYRSIDQRHIVALIAVLVLYLIFLILVLDMEFAGERLKGFLQLSYSLAIGYAAYLTCTLYDRDRLARIFLVFCIAILIGCALETTATGFRAVSDMVRERLFDEHLYDAAARDVELYGGLRPNLFTSEPSNVGFAFTAYAFFWYVLTTVRGKTLWYAALLGAGLLLTRSPTVVLGFALIAPYQLLIAGRSAAGRTRGADQAAMTVAALTLFGVGAIAIAGGHLFAERLATIGDNNDASFFYRVIGPAAVALDTMSRYPIAGAGLTGEEYITDRVYQIYVTWPGFSPQWRVDKISEVLTNYFWYHWIYLGLVGGLCVLAALFGLLRTLAAPSAVFCLLVWAIMGQASGGYVAPRPWMVLLLACAVSCLHFRQPESERRAAVAHAAGRRLAGGTRRRVEFP